jgi:hypothetical protein
MLTQPKLKGKSPSSADGTKSPTLFNRQQVKLNTAGFDPFAIDHDTGNSTKCKKIRFTYSGGRTVRGARRLIDITSIEILKSLD